MSRWREARHVREGRNPSFSRMEVSHEAQGRWHMLKADFSPFYSLSSLRCLCPHQKGREHVSGCDLWSAGVFGLGVAPMGVQWARPCQVPAHRALSSAPCLPRQLRGFPALSTNPETAVTVLGTGAVLSLLRTILLWLWAEGGETQTGYMEGIPACEGGGTGCPEELNTPLKSHFLRWCHWADGERDVIVVFMFHRGSAASELWLLLFSNCAKIQIMRCWMCLRASESCQCSWIYPAMGLFPQMIFRAFFKVKKFYQDWVGGDLFRLSCLGALFFLQWWEKGRSWNREKSFVTFHQLIFAWAFSCKLLRFFFGGGL